MRKSIKKSLFCVVSLIFVMLMLFAGLGFSRNETNLSQALDKVFYFQLSTENNYDGTVQRRVEFVINSKALNASESEIAIYKQRMENLMVSLYNEEVEYLESKLTSETPDELNFRNEENPATSFQPTYLKDYDEYLFLIKFPSSAMYNYYYDDVEFTSEEGFFVTKTYQTQAFPITEEKATKFKESFLLAIKGLSFESQITNGLVIRYVYDYVTINPRVKSNADSIEQDSSGYYHHFWLMQGDYSTDTVQVSLSVVHKGWWYLLGFGVPLIVMGVAIVVVKCIDKNKKRKDFQNKVANIN
jgi:hypothetical protein